MLLTDSAGSSDARMTIFNNGNVGIGEATNPQTKLAYFKSFG